MKFVPNLGAEEGVVDPAVQPFLRTPIRCLSWILPAGAEVLGAPSAAPWPAFLGPPTQSAAFPWLQGDGWAWYGTEEAAEALRGAGATPAFPPPALVRQVHDKAFAQEAAGALGLIPPCLVGEVQVFEPEAITREAIAALVTRLPSWVGSDWMLKPRLGSSGRGRVRRLDDVEGARDRLASRGGAIFEPWLDRVEDLSALLFVHPNGAQTWIGSTRQILRGAGVYLGTEGIIGPSGEVRAGTPWDDELRSAAESMGEAASRRGYFGPLGMDAFVFHGPRGVPVLRPVVELNARLTMGMVALGLLARTLGAGTLPPSGTFRFLLREGVEEVLGGRTFDLGGGASLSWAPETESAC